MSKEDGAATLTAFTAESIAMAQQHFPVPAKRWYIAGGGRRNPAIMQALTRLLKNVKPVETLGWHGDAMEAQAFAYLAVRSMKKLPLSLPTTTGAGKVVTGGAFYSA
jgi:anhydro-N-acetylmuramic acid kinase